MSSIEETFTKSEKTDAVLLVTENRSNSETPPGEGLKSGKPTKLHVNKALLSYHSDYFKKLFETDSGNEFLIEVTDLDVFAFALSLIQNNPMKFEYWSLNRIVEMIDKFQFPAAKRPLELILISQCSSSTCVSPAGMILQADKFKMNELMKRVLPLLTQEKEFSCFYRHTPSNETAVLLFNRMMEIRYKKPSSKTEPDYNSIFRKTDTTDAILVVDGKKLHVNKAVLSYYSDYFKTLFESDFKEKSMNEIPIEDVDFENFATFLSLVLKDPIMPTRKFFLIILKCLFNLVNNAEKLLELADQFLLPAAKRHVESVLIESSIDTLNKIRIADKFQLEDLLKQGIEKFKDVARFFEDDRANSWLTSLGLGLVIKEYVHPELLEGIDFEALGFNGPDILADDGLELVTRLMENTQGRLRMHLPVKDFTERLRVYRKFTGSHIFFNMPRLHPYNHAFDKYVAGGDFYHLKQDLLVRLQSDILDKCPEMRVLPRTVLVVYLKNTEDFLENRLEYVRESTNKGNFEKIEALVTEEMKKMKDHITKPLSTNRKKRVTTFRLDNPRASLNEIYQGWMTKLPSNWSPDQHQYMKMALEIHLSAHPPAQEPYIFAEAAYCCNVLFDLLGKIFDKWKQFYTLYAVSGAERPLVCRGFADVGKEYVMFHEFNAALQQKYGDRFEAVVQPHRWLPYEDHENLRITDEMNTLWREYGRSELLTGLTFIFIATNKGKRTPPVMLDGGEFVRPSAQAMNDILRRLALGWKFFQRVDKKEASNYQIDLKNILRDGFSFDQEDRSFITNERLRHIWNRISALCAPFKTNIIQVPDNLEEGAGYTYYKLEELASRMVSAEVCRGFQDKLLSTYKQNIDYLRGPENWRVNHVFDVIEQAQATCFVLRFQEILEFYHHQQVTHDENGCFVCYAELVAMTEGRQIM
uniref:BTB domain-containing protein n=1 Tax=Caenorhabditis tropicalis TaxID=1561998 RepID=A0A1I7UI40_9PELO